ncbi:Fic family protein [Schaalia suimastitidis]|uniref:Fic family protein n=1 Tax=Schaalia suimastitidis TaxID=121163 RepID=UPI00041A8BE7|nr:Fic/DOC family N-terminal domain-containing protein [Schaalia suimastitidis]
MWITPEKPYQELPALPPATDVESPAVLKAVIAASRSVSALDAACRRLPDPTMLINAIPLLEAQASSEIENIVTTNDELFRAAHHALGQAATPAAKEALRYRTALRVGSESIEERPLRVRTAVEVCSTLLGYSVSVRDKEGTYIGNPATREIIYTPPTGTDVLNEHLIHWETFLHADHGIDPLVMMALQHYQFEAIHPFPDANGRTGRIINLLFLKEKGLLNYPVLYLSGYIVRNKRDYYRLLRAVTEKDEWEPWLLFMIRGCDLMAQWTLHLIEKIVALQECIENRIRETIPRAPAAELARLLFTQPYIRIDDVVAANLAQRATASTWLRALSDEQIVATERIGRSKIFINYTLLESLFAAPLAN